MTQHNELRLKKFDKSPGAPLKLVRITCKQETSVVGVSVSRLANIWFYQNYVGWKFRGFICLAHFRHVVNSVLVISGKQNILILLREFRDFESIWIVEIIVLIANNVSGSFRLRTFRNFHFVFKIWLNLGHENWQKSKNVQVQIPKLFL